LCFIFKHKVTLKRFLVYYFLYGFGIVLLSIGLKSFLSADELFISNYWLLFTYLFFLTLIAFFVSYIGAGKEGQIGAMAIMGGLVFKFLFALSFFVFLRFKTEEDLMLLGLNFIILYFLLTVFEVVGLLRILRLRK